MDAQLSRRRVWRRPIVLTILGIAFLTVYFGSFWMLRKSAAFVEMLPIEKDGEPKILMCRTTLYSFSAHRPTNRVLYIAYWPIHAILLQGDSESALWADRKSSHDCGRKIYVEDSGLIKFDDHPR